MKYWIYVTDTNINLDNGFFKEDLEILLKWQIRKDKKCIKNINLFWIKRICYVNK